MLQRVRKKGQEPNWRFGKGFGLPSLPNMLLTLFPPVRVGLTGKRDVDQIVGFDRRRLNWLSEAIPILFGHDEGCVWFDKSDGEKEWFVVIFQ